MHLIISIALGIFGIWLLYRLRRLISMTIIVSMALVGIVWLIATAGPYISIIAGDIVLAGVATWLCWPKRQTSGRG